MMLSLRMQRICLLAVDDDDDEVANISTITISTAPHCEYSRRSIPRQYQQLADDTDRYTS